MLYDHPVVKTPEQALVSLVDSRYGFTVCDLGIDLSEFELFSITKAKKYNQFDDFDHTEEKIAAFLSEIGDNDTTLVKRAAAKINSIVNRIMQLSGREAACIELKSSIPTNEYDLPRWHMDGRYYKNRDTLQYKFATNLIGPATLFYFLSTESQETRSILSAHMKNRQFTSEFCQKNKVFFADKGQGVFFIAANMKKAALHSEPPIHENRLFFSITPCNKEEAKELEFKIVYYYKEPALKIISNGSS